MYFLEEKKNMHINENLFAGDILKDSIAPPWHKKARSGCQCTVFLKKYLSCIVSKEKIFMQSFFFFVQFTFSKLREISNDSLIKGPESENSFLKTTGDRCDS